MFEALVHISSHPLGGLKNHRHNQVDAGEPPRGWHADAQPVCCRARRTARPPPRSRRPWSVAATARGRMGMRGGRRRPASLMWAGRSAEGVPFSESSAQPCACAPVAPDDTSGCPTSFDRHANRRGTAP
jgi:hypothetical protein